MHAALTFRGDPVVRHAPFWKFMFAGHWPAWGLYQIVAPALRSPGVKASHYRPCCQLHNDGPIIDAEGFA